MKKIITYGTFDLFHRGHLEILRRAKELGDYLIVGVATDQFNALKGKKAYYSYQDRAAIVAAIRYVDLVIPENNWEQKRSDIAELGADILVMGHDWQGKFDDLSDVIEVKYLARTEGISTSIIKDDLKE